MYYVITNTTERNGRHSTEQKANVLEDDGVHFRYKFLGTAKEFSQRKIQLKCYKDILLTGNQYNISNRYKNQSMTRKNLTLN